jgi:hypothetical protein
MTVFARNPGRVRALLALALTAVLAFAALTAHFATARAATAQAAPRLLQLSSDPYTAATCTASATTYHRTEVEPDTFAFGSTIVATEQVARVFNGGACDIGFATSTNGGKTWTHGVLPGTTVFATPPGIYARTSDPTVAFDARHNVWLISYLGLKTLTDVDVLVSRSTDGGLTWGLPVAVNASGDFNDKNWTVCDNTTSSPFFGNCYTEFDDVTFQDLEQMSTSSDGGLTWGAAQPTANHAHGLGGQPVVQPSGTVVVPYNGFQGRAGAIDAFTSSDGGASWSNASIVSLISFHGIAGNIRAGTLPSAEIDAAGTVYVAWADCRFEAGCAANDIVFSTSSDGVNWTAPARVPADAVGSGVDHFLPGLGVDKATAGSSAHLGLVYYFYPVANCTTATCQLDAGFISSTDGGATWSARQQLAGPMTLTWLPLTSQGYMVGDYMSTSFSGGPAYPALMSATAPTSGTTCGEVPDNCNEPLNTVAGGISVTGGRNSSHGDVVVVLPADAPLYTPPPTDR